MGIKITVTGIIKEHRALKSPDQKHDWHCIEIETSGSKSAPKGLPLPSQDVQVTVLANDKQMKKLMSSSNVEGDSPVGLRCLVAGELTLDLSYDVLAGDIGIIAFSIERMEEKAAKKESQAEEKAPELLVEAATTHESIEAKEPAKDNKIPINLIDIPESFARTRPREEKIESAIDFFNKNGFFDKPVCVEPGAVEGRWQLTDGYIRYVAAKRLGLEAIDVQR
ncbi:hypothetical protein J2T17_004356 [Paenibacillus mucilaginosus]|uniref:ParB N-terminal domain-containing protein n=1 Tax=Paenibacillus mucilaginosus TaxID=61624 RepID=UPI003D1CB03A